LGALPPNPRSIFSQMKNLDGIEVAPVWEPSWFSKGVFGLALLLGAGDERQGQEGQRFRQTGALDNLPAPRWSMSHNDCLVYLHRRVASAKLALDRSKSVSGRLYNRLTGERADVILVSGQVLQTVSRVTGHREAFDELDAGLEYHVPLPLAERLLTALRAKVPA